MRRSLLWATLIAAASIVGASWLGSPAGAQQMPSGKVGTEKPAAQAPSSPDHVFVNGALAVSGAPAESDTVPAKFSEKNAADDRLITVAYTFKELSADQRRAIYQALKEQPATGSAVTADVGVVLPPSVDLRAVPDQIAARVPEAKGYQFAVAGNGVLVVSPTTRVVVGVFGDGR
jgi:hypothetical protein